MQPPDAPFRPPPKLNPFKNGSLRGAGKGFRGFMPGPVIPHIAPEGDMTPGSLTKDLPHGTKDLPHGARPAGRSPEEGRPAYPVPEQVATNELGSVIRPGRSEGRPATPVSDNGLENLEDFPVVSRGGGKPVGIYI